MRYRAVDYLAQRFCAALLAISDRFSAVMPSALAFPPFLPIATATGSLPCPLA
jgi:hypothetical protein